MPQFSDLLTKYKLEKSPGLPVRIWYVHVNQVVNKAVHTVSMVWLWVRLAPESFRL